MRVSFCWIESIPLLLSCMDFSDHRRNRPGLRCQVHNGVKAPPGGLFRCYSATDPSNGHTRDIYIGWSDVPKTDRAPYTLHNRDAKRVLYRNFKFDYMASHMQESHNMQLNPCLIFKHPLRTPQCRCEKGHRIFISAMTAKKTLKSSARKVNVTKVKLTSGNYSDWRRGDYRWLGYRSNCSKKKKKKSIKLHW